MLNKFKNFDKGFVCFGLARPYLFVLVIQFFLLSNVSAYNLADPNTYLDPGKVERLMHKPNSPEEALVYSFVDWCIDSIEALNSEGKVKVETNNNYKIVHDGDSYEVRLSPFNIRFSTSERLELEQVLFKCRPMDKGLLDFVILVPEKLILKSGKDVDAVITTARRDISGQWDKGIQDFRTYNVLVEDLVVSDPKNVGTLRIAGGTLNGVLTFGNGGKWKQKVKGLMRGAEFKLHDKDERAHLRLKSLGFESDTAASNYQVYSDIKRKLRSLIFKEDATAKEAENLVHRLDVFLQNFGHENASATLEGLSFQTSDDNATFFTDSLKINSSYKRKPGSKTRLSGSVQTVLTNFGFSKTDKGSQTPVSVKIAQIKLNNKIDTGVIPPNLFKSINLASNASSTMPIDEDKKVEWYLSQAITKWTDILEKGSMEIAFKDIQAITTKLPPLAIGSAWIGCGMDFRPSRENVVRINAGYSDFKCPSFKERIKSANLFLRLANLPSISELLPGSDKNKQGDIGEEVVKKLKHTINVSTMELSVMASLIGVPASAATFDIDIKSDPKAKFFSTGYVNITLEGPDNFMKIINALYPKPGLLQMIAAVTALGQRLEKDGKVIDQLNLTVDKNGRIFLNKKDITNLFFSTGEGAKSGVKSSSPSEQKEAHH